MTDYIKLKESNCKNCYKCIRYCPVKSIKFADNEAHIVGDECILCGRCYVVCPQNAKKIRNDTDKIKNAIKAGKNVIASVAPSFVAEYDGANITMLSKALEKLGFIKAEETSIGATIVKTEYDNILNSNTKNVVISSCCHTVNTLIQKYYPEVLPFLAHVVTPMDAHCAKIKRENDNAFTVFIGPCISKKEEADLCTSSVNCVLTYAELNSWFEDENVTLEQCDDEIGGGKARFFPVVGGIIRSMKCDAKNYDYITVDGIDNCVNAIKDIMDGNLDNCFIEMSACSGGCIEGPGTNKTVRPVRDFLSVSNYAVDGDYPTTEADYKHISKEMNFIGLHRQMPGSKAIEEILKKMGKTDISHELNCGSCGYETCREKAIAIYLGKADLNMCLPYLKEKAESFSDNIISNTPNAIIVLDENLEIQQINAAALEMINIKNQRDVLSTPVVRIMNPQEFLQVMTTGEAIRDKRIYLAEYKKYVEETIVYDSSYHIIICFMRDVTVEELQRRKKEQLSNDTITITDKIIEKQMRIVQEIASLLGETTAETKIALTNLKESLKDE